MGCVPTPLSQALEELLAGVETAPLRAATAALVAAYRSGVPPAGLVLADGDRAAAYAARCARPSATSAARSNAHASTAGWLRTKVIARDGTRYVLAW